MTLIEAKELYEQYQHLRGQKINTQVITQLLILPSPCSSEQFSKALREVAALGHSEPDTHHSDYQLLILFDHHHSLSISPEPLQYDSLSNVLNKLKK